MLYQLVLITNLGVVTPLATFSNWNDCMKEQNRVPTVSTQQYSVSCLPTESPEQLQKRANEGVKMMMSVLDTMQKEMK
jgi:hypothetical protein